MTSFPEYVLEYFHCKQVNTTKRVKVYCISDLHIDAPKNETWVRNHCEGNLAETSDVFSIIIIPGDVGSELGRMQTTFKLLVNNYDIVCYVPGNHEAWRRGSLASPDGKACDSISKITEVLSIATDCGVTVGPVRVSSLLNIGFSVVIVPLYSWYHSSWDKEPRLIDSLFQSMETAMPFDQKWGDFATCTWPKSIISRDNFASCEHGTDHLAQWFSRINDPFLRALNSPETIVHEGDTVISFSHFLPRQELCPEKRYLFEPMLTRVIGSDFLEEQIRVLMPHLHLFGHTHIPMDLTLECVRYVQWPLGYTRESTMQCSKIFQTGPLLVYDSDLHQSQKQEQQQHNNNTPSTRSGSGSGVPEDMPSYDTQWSAHYRTHPRDCTVLEPLAPWLLQRLQGFAEVLADAGAGAGATTQHTGHSTS